MNIRHQGVRAETSECKGPGAGVCWACVRTSESPVCPEQSQGGEMRELQRGNKQALEGSRPAGAGRKAINRPKGQCQGRHTI